MATDVGQASAAPKAIDLYVCGSHSRAQTAAARKAQQPETFHRVLVTLIDHHANPHLVAQQLCCITWYSARPWFHAVQTFTRRHHSENNPPHKSNCTIVRRHYSSVAGNDDASADGAPFVRYGYSAKWVKLNVFPCNRKHDNVLMTSASSPLCVGQTWYPGGPGALPAKKTPIVSSLSCDIHPSLTPEVLGVY